MPRKNLAGSFEPHPHYRWGKMIKGVRHFLLCRSQREGEFRKNTGWLGLPEELWTKVDSLPYANKWWESRPVVDPALEKFRARYAEHPSMSPEVVDEIWANGQKAKRAIQRAGIPLEKVTPRMEYEFLSKIDSIVELDPPPTDKTCAGVINRFLVLRLAEVNAGKRSVTGYDNIRRYLGEFSKFLGTGFDFSLIDDIHWEKFYLHVTGKMASKDWGDAYSADVLSYCRNLIKWASKQRLCVRPNTLDDFRIAVSDPEVVETYTIAEVKKCLAAATGQTKLHLLLMLNLGHTQIDISDLEKSQVDLKAGTITRKRSKTRGKKTVPLVTYKLWPETLKELKIHMVKCSDPKFALSTRAGKRWVRSKLKENGKLSKADGVDSNFNHVQLKTGIKKGLSVFRATSSNLLNDNETHRGMKPLFLGHSNKLLADRRYSNAPNSPLTKAIEWLRKQYALEDLFVQKQCQ